MTLLALFIAYFVPHERNEFKPHFLRGEMAAAIALSIVAVFIIALAEERFIVTNPAPQTAAVVSSSLVDLANADRASIGLPALAVNTQLQEAAQLKADDMASNDYFAHMSPSGKDPWYWFQQAGYDFSYAGENLAVYFSDSGDVNNAWMNSPEHRGNLLNANYTQIGIATAEGMYKGVETTFVVQEFGAPAEVSTAPQPVEKEQEPAPAPSGEPTVAAAEAAPAPVVVSQKANAPVSGKDDAVKMQNAPTVAPAPQSVPEDNSLDTFFLKFLTSPNGDLAVAYDTIGAVIALALILEIGVEMKRQHPRRIAIGFSLIALMLVLAYADHAYFASQLVIA